MADQGSENCEKTVREGHRTQHGSSAAPLAAAGAGTQHSLGAQDQACGARFTNHASAACTGPEVTPDGGRGVEHPGDVALGSVTDNGPHSSDADAQGHSVVEANGAPHVSVSDVTTADAGVTAVVYGEASGRGAVVSADGGGDSGAGIGGGRPGASTNRGEASSSADSAHPVEDKSVPHVVQPGVEHQQGYCRVTSWAFARKFRHVGINAAQAERLVYEDVRRNWDLVSSRCGVVLGDDGATVLGVCQLQLRGDKRVPVPGGVITEILGCGCCRSIKLGVLEGHECAVGECYVAHIAVLAEARGKGIGGALMRWADEYAVAQGCHVISLYVATTNRAVHLYERQGFEVEKGPCCGGWCSLLSRCWIGEPGFAFMVKDLRPPAGT